MSQAHARKRTGRSQDSGATLGQARSSKRKRARQQENRETLKREADKLGINPSLLACRRFQEKQRIIAARAAEDRRIQTASLESSYRRRYPGY